MSVVQQVGFDGQAASSKAVTITSSTAGNTIMVFTAGLSAPSGVPTDNLSTTWPAASVAALPNTSLTAYVLQNCPAGITTITVHQSGCQGWIVEESGVLASSLDQARGQSTTGTTLTSGNTSTLAQASEVCYGFFSHGSSTNFTQGSGWDSSAFTNYGGTGGAGYTSGNQGNTLEADTTFIERQVVASTSALAATSTLGASATADAGIITLKINTTPAVVQSTTAVGSGNVVSGALNGVTAGNAVIAVLSYYENGPTNNTVAPTPTDSNGTFVVASAPTPAFMVPAAIGSVGTAVWYEANAASGTHTITQTNASGPLYRLHLTLLEVSNLGATPAIAAAANTFVSSGALGPATQIFPSGIMNQNPAFIVGLVAVASSTGVTNAGITTPTGFTNVNSGSNTSTDIAYEHGYQAPTVGGPFQASWAWSDNTTSGAQAMLVGFGTSSFTSTNTGTPLGGPPRVQWHWRTY